MARQPCGKRPGSDRHDDTGATGSAGKPGATGSAGKPDAQASADVDHSNAGSPGYGSDDALAQAHPRRAAERLIPR